MKKESLSGLVIALIVVQIFLLLGFFSLSSKVEDMYFAIKNMEGNISSNINSIESEITYRLEQEATLIESIEVDFGELDRKSLTIPITYTIIPKESSEDTILSLQFDKETLEMKRNISIFTLTVDTDIFAYEVNPNIIISEDGKMKTEKNDELYLYNIKDYVFPDVSMNYYGEFDLKRGEMKFNGLLNYQEEDSKGLNTINYTEARLVIKAADALILEKNIDIKDLDGYQIEEEIPLKDGQSCEIYVIAKDELNLEHHLLVGSYSKNEDEFVYEEDVEYVDDINQKYGGMVYSQDGEQLWPPEVK
ncbi:MAG TPA: hypothetical protein GX705_02115 [Clostridiales bacterium]|nr:hypothetical protein [Clostridiales bacterium]